MSRNSSVVTTLRDVNEPILCSKRVGHGVLGFVADLNLSRREGLLRLQDRRNWLTLLRCPCQNVTKLIKP